MTLEFIGLNINLHYSRKQATSTQNVNHCTTNYQQHINKNRVPSSTRIQKPRLSTENSKWWGNQPLTEVPFWEEQIKAKAQDLPSINQQQYPTQVMISKSHRSRPQQQPSLLVDVGQTSLKTVTTASPYLQCTSPIVITPIKSTHTIDTSSTLSSHTWESNDDDLWNTINNSIRSEAGINNTTIHENRSYIDWISDELPEPTPTTPTSPIPSSTLECNQQQSSPSNSQFSNPIVISLYLKLENDTMVPKTDAMKRYYQ
ncbi:hypothetical protein BC941DRAFT_135878 [Chlamydoabsidia padenii]|nr:hypothetical protein BC941DRAFT_135878 [Chlamydoabsidia padenii]